MQKFNYHTHTSRCNHAVGTDEEYVLCAVESGLKILGFSDHAPFSRYFDNSRMKFSELPEYINSIKQLQKQYKNKIDIRIGFEFEYFKEVKKEIENLRELSDYLILGQHNREFAGLDFGRQCTDDDLLIYTGSVVEAMESGLADIVAHPDYFMLGRSRWNASCENAAEKIAEASKKYNIPLELNLNGIRYGRHEINEEMRYAYPFREFWEIIAEYQCPVVMGWDAHDPKLFLDKKRISQVKDLVSDLNLNFLETLDLRRK